MCRVWRFKRLYLLGELGQGHDVALFFAIASVRGADERRYLRLGHVCTDSSKVVYGIA